MAVRRRRSKNFARFITPIATLLILGYFGFHAFNGHYGVRARIAMEQQIAVLEQEKADKTKLRLELENRVKLIRDGSLERDMVDEQVRAQLGMAKPDEIVILYPKD
ncbi:MAG: septum formation initiator family protein [Pseudomonadota bacterium]